MLQVLNTKTLNRAILTGSVIVGIAAIMIGATVAPVYAVIAVDIDIKPGSDPNCFNNDGNGVIPVAILGSASFDATQVDPLTLSLDGQSVKTKGNGAPQASVEDVNNDGFDDLVVKIIDTDGTYTVGTVTATLTGQLFDGVSIVGSDSICITQ